MSCRGCHRIFSQTGRQADLTPQSQKASLNLSNIPLAGHVTRDSGMGIATSFGMISERATRMAKKEGENLKQSIKD